MHIIAAQGTLACAVAIALSQDGPGSRVGFVIVFLIAAPAVAGAALLVGLDLSARIVLAFAVAVVINALVAEVMVATGRWSVSGGVLAVGLLSAVMWMAAGAASQVRPSGGRHTIRRAEQDSVGGTP